MIPIKVVIAVSYIGRTSSGVGLASVAADNGISISFKHGSRSWSASTGKENCCDIMLLLYHFRISVLSFSLTLP